MTVPGPETFVMFDTLQSVAAHCGQDIIGFNHPAVDETYDGVIVSSYVEVRCAGGDYGIAPGGYLIQGKRGLFYAKPDDPENKWTPDASAPAEAEAETDEGEDEAPADVVMAANSPEVPEDSEYADWLVKDLKVALAEENQPVKGKRPDLLARLHWLTHERPDAEGIEEA